MAYLANDDEDSKMTQSKAAGGSFNAFDQNNQAAKSGTDLGMSGWMGGGGGATDSSAQANKNASNASQSGGDSGSSGGSSGGTSKAQTPAQPSTAQTGLSGSSAGTGFINFNNYENNNASQAGKISDAGTKTFGDENKNLDTAEQPLKDQATAVGFKDQADADAQTQAALSGGGLDKISSWINPKNNQTTIDYNPSDAFAKNASELSEQGPLGGKASVVDYLAQPQISQGKYTGGERGFDQALIGGDVKSQNAIQANAGLNDALTKRMTTEIPDLEKKAQANQGIVQQNSVMANRGLQDAANKIQSDAQASGQAQTATQDAYKAAMDAATKNLAFEEGRVNGDEGDQLNANRQQAASNYKNYYDQLQGLGSKIGGGGGNGMTADQMNQMNQIAKLQGKPAPYDAGALSGAAQTTPGSMSLQNLNDWINNAQGQFRASSPSVGAVANPTTFNGKAVYKVDPATGKMVATSYDPYDKTTDWRSGNTTPEKVPRGVIQQKDKDIYDAKKARADQARGRQGSY